MAVKQVRRGKGGLTNSVVIERVKQWVFIDREAKQLEARKKELREDFLRWVEHHGKEDEKGNWFLDLPEEVEGVGAIKRERVVSQSFDWDGAEALVRKKGLNDCIKTVEVLDEDAFEAAVFRGDITPKEFAKLRSESVSYRLKMVVAK